MHTKEPSQRSTRDTNRYRGTHAANLIDIIKYKQKTCRLREKKVKQSIMGKSKTKTFQNYH